MRIGLKDCEWERAGNDLILVCDPSRSVKLDDPDGQVETLLTALRNHPGTLTELRAALAADGLEVSVDELTGALNALDQLRLVRDLERFADRAQAGRDFSNLAFFELYASLENSESDMQQGVRNAHVLQLGTGGLGSNVLQNLAGLGVGRLTLVDNDEVEPRNLARQFLYREADLGTSKVHRAAEWVRAFHSDITVDAVRRWIGGPGDIVDLLPGVDLVVSGVDQGERIDNWVNEVCVRAGVPWVRGGMIGSQLIYFSVDPGRSACYECRIHAYGDGKGVQASVLAPTAVTAQQLSARIPRVNRANGPSAALIGSLVAFEALRYLTGYEPPYAAGAEVLVDLSGGCHQRREPWPRNADCALCTGARARTALTPA
ncbi:HesA/MoeB/ThiF family protein [Micromonospora sp. NPDC048930]|uniref:HesA/MoeB/ThiF family protein n=1 Tax=Micromonospora sp. NPDC048930 TaxID=3364261 RepID=UPI00371C5640